MGLNEIHSEALSGWWGSCWKNIHGLRGRAMPWGLGNAPEFDLRDKKKKVFGVYMAVSLILAGR